MRAGCDQSQGVGRVQWTAGEWQGTWSRGPLSLPPPLPPSPRGGGDVEKQAQHKETHGRATGSEGPRRVGNWCRIAK